MIKNSNKGKVEGKVRPRMGHEVWIYSFFKLGARWGGCLTPHPSRFIPGQETQYPLCRRPRKPVWTGAKNFAPTGFRSPDRPDRIESVYGIHYLY
jgi:hypothetical protein